MTDRHAVHCARHSHSVTLFLLPNFFLHAHDTTLCLPIVAAEAIIIIQTCRPTEGLTRGRKLLVFCGNNSNDGQLTAEQYTHTALPDAIRVTWPSSTSAIAVAVHEIVKLGGIFISADAA